MFGEPDEEQQKNFRPGDDSEENKKWQKDMVWPYAQGEEKEQINKMYEKLQEDFKDIPKYPEVTGEYRMVRFLRGFNRDVDVAVSAVRNMLEIRKEYDMDQVREKYKECDLWDLNTHEDTKEYNDTVMRYLPTYDIGFNEQGHLINYMPLGDHNPKAFVKDVGLDDGEFLKHQVIRQTIRMKTMNDQSEKMGSLCKFIMVVDFLGVGLSNVRYKPMREFQKKHSNRLQNIQANHSGRIFIINTPWWMKTFWRTVDKWIPENTKRKIFLLGKNYRDELLKVLSARTLQKLLELRQSDESGNDKSGEAKISKGKEMEKILLLQPGQTVKWTFDVKEKGGIDFSVSMYKREDGSTGIEKQTLVEVERFKADDGEIEGEYTLDEDEDSDEDEGKKSHNASNDGMISLKWSNSFSWSRGKTINFKIEIEGGDEDEEEDDSSSKK
jgi:hypothetical protein